MPQIDTYIANLHAERHRAWNEQKAILDRAIAEKREQTAEERQTVQRTDDAIDRLDEEINSWVERAKREQEADAARESYAPFVGVDRSTSGEDLGRQFVGFLRGQNQGNADNGRAFEIDLIPAIRERQALRAGARGIDLIRAAHPQIERVLSSVTAAAGGALVPTDFVRQLYDYMETYNGVLQTGATVLTTTGGNPISMPRVLTGGTATLTGEGTAIGGTDPTFGTMTLNSWRYGQLIALPRELIEDDGVDTEGWLARDFGRAIGRATNAAYTTGTGTNQPEGFAAVCGTGVTGAVGGTGIFSFDNLIDLEYSVNSAYAQNAVWTAKRATIGAMRKLKDTDGQYLWQPSNIVGEPSTLDGYRVVENPDMAAVGTGLLSVVFGDFSPFIVRVVNGIRVERSADYAFDKDQITWKAVLRTDSGLLDLTGAIKAYRGGTA